MIKLEEGLRLKSVLWSRNNYTVGNEYVNDRGYVESITISMQRGQMAMVPWAEIKFSDDSIILFNCALMEGCEVLIT